MSVEAMSDKADKFASAAEVSVYGAEKIVHTEAEHTEVILPKVEATYTETGLTEGSYCKVCGEVVVAQNVIPVIPEDSSKDLLLEKITPTTGSEEPYSDEHRNEGPLSYAFDGNTETFWHSAYATPFDVNNYQTEMPNHFWVEMMFSEATVVDAVRYLPRGTGNGDITGYRIEGTVDGENWEVLTSGTWEHNANWKIAVFEARELLGVKLVATETKASAANGEGNYNKFANAKEIRVRMGETGIEAPVGPTNIALGKTVVASGAPSSTYTAQKAVDGNTDGQSRFDLNDIKNVAGEDTDDSWMYVDLGEEKTYEISQIVARFFNKVYPTSWYIEVSNDTQNWTKVTETLTKEDNGATYPVETINFETPVSGRYVRAYFETLNTAAAGNAVSIIEFEVYGIEVATENVVDRTALNNAIAEAKAINSELYTEESYAAVVAAVNAAEALGDEVEQDEVNVATAAIKNAIAALALKPVATNVALRKNVVARYTADNSNSGTNSQRPLSMAVDGTNNNINNYGEFGRDNDRSSQYLQVDLGTTYDIASVNLYRYWSDGRIYGDTVIAVANKEADFAEGKATIIYNADDADIHELGAGSAADYAESSEGKSWAAPEGTCGRYVRVYTYGSDKGTTNHIVELEVMGFEHNHTEETVAGKDATCTEPGLTAGTKCSACDEVLGEQEEIPALEHAWGEWTESKAAGCEEAGEEKRECVNCDASETREIAATGHDYDAVVTAPTCTAGGYTTYTCACGDVYTDNVVPALGHTEVIDPRVEPTYTTTGLTEGKHCEVCKEVLVKQEVIPVIIQYLTLTVANDGETTSAKYEIGEQVTIVADEKEGYEFLYWVNVDGSKILSSNATYTFALYTNLSVKAVYEEIVEMPIIVFKTTAKFSNQMVAREQADEEGYVTLPKPNEYAGYKFVGWDITGDGKADITDVVGARVAVTADATWLAVYESDNIVGITVEGGKIVSASSAAVDTNQYAYGTSLTIQATGEKGKVFAGWYDEADQLLSTKSTYTFTLNSTRTIVAHYEEEKVEVKPVVSFVIKDRTEITGKGDQFKLGISWEVPAGYTIVAEGILRTYAENAENILVVGTTNADVKQHNCANVSASGSYTYNFGINATSANVEKDVYARGFIRCKNNSTGKIETFYTSVVVIEAID